MKKYRSPALLIALITIATMIGASCSSTAKLGTQSSDPKIVTSFYPVEFVVNKIVGDDYKVINLTPLGTEPHDLELSPSDTSNLLDAKLAIVMGNGFQPAIEKTASSRDGATLTILKEVKTSNSDPHIWLDPEKMTKVVQVIADQLIGINPTRKLVYEKNASLLISDLKTLDESYKEALGSCELTTFVTSHEAFSQLAIRYGLKQMAIAGLSPENEPTPSKLKQISKTVKENDIDVIFTEEQVSKKLAQSLSKQAGIKTEILSPIEGLTKEQVDAKQDYFTLMQKNLEKLSNALKCSGSF